MAANAENVKNVMIFGDAQSGKASLFKSMYNGYYSMPYKFSNLKCYGSLKHVDYPNTKLNVYMTKGAVSFMPGSTIALDAGIFCIDSRKKFDIDHARKQIENFRNTYGCPVFIVITKLDGQGIVIPSTDYSCELTEKIEQLKVEMQYQFEDIYLTSAYENSIMRVRDFRWIDSDAGYEYEEGGIYNSSLMHKLFTMNEEIISPPPPRQESRSALGNFFLKLSRTNERNKVFFIIALLVTGVMSWGATSIAGIGAGATLFGLTGFGAAAMFGLFVAIAAAVFSYAILVAVCWEPEPMETETVVTAEPAHYAINNYTLPVKPFDDNYQSQVGVAFFKQGQYVAGSQVDTGSLASPTQSPQN